MAETTTTVKGKTYFSIDLADGIPWLSQRKNQLPTRWSKIDPNGTYGYVKTYQIGKYTKEQAIYYKINSGWFMYPSGVCCMTSTCMAGAIAGWYNKAKTGIDFSNTVVENALEFILKGTIKGNENNELLQKIYGVTNNNWSKVGCDLHMFMDKCAKVISYQWGHNGKDLITTKNITPGSAIQGGSDDKAKTGLAKAAWEQININRAPITCSVKYGNGGHIVCIMGASWLESDYTNAVKNKTIPEPAYIILYDPYGCRCNANQSYPSKHKDDCSVMHELGNGERVYVKFSYMASILKNWQWYWWIRNK